MSIWWWRNCFLCFIVSSPEHEELSELLWSFIVRRPASVRASVCVCVNNFFVKTTSPLKPLIGFWPNFTGMIPWWSPIKVVQTVPVGCISMSQGQKIVFQNAIFKNLLVRNYKAQSFYIWCIAPSRGPLPKLFKLCPWGQN